MVFRIIILLTTALAGCGHSSGVPLAKVTGRLTFYARPVPAEILFQPEGDDRKPTGRPSTAIADENGEYTLQFTEQEAGAVIGRQRVTIKVLPFADSGEPATFQDATTPLKVVRLIREVQPGSNQFDFVLTY